MQAILKPTTRPELGEIIINEDVFAIGRHEEPFAHYATPAVAKLSRRHARIFEQDGIVYITDLGSLNGTSVNGQKVNTQPVRLQRGDRICFTDLCYDIEILGAAARHAPAPPAVPLVQLILVPEKQKMALEPIVVTRFPFLVNKTSDVFSRYRKTLAEEVSYISRRHAHLFPKGRDLYIEDLGSTNGTFLNGQRLEEHAMQLHNGDVIAFGGDNFVYRVQLLYTGEEPQSEAQRDASKLLTGTAAGGEEVTRTTFVTSANSFLDIYCLDGEQDDAAADAGNRADGSEQTRIAVAGGAGGRWRRVIGRWLSLLREVRGEVTEPKTGGRRKYWLAAVLLAAGAAGWAYLDTAPRREIQQLLDSGEYLKAVTQANLFLARHPDDRDVSDLATGALLKAVVPDWQRAVVAGDFQPATRRLDRGMQLAGPNNDSRQLLETLLWVTRLEDFIAQRGGADAPVVMFREEETLRQLTGWWNNDAPARRRSLGAIAQYVPEFAEMRATVFSHVRTLDSQQAVSLAAIARLSDTVRESLKEGEPGTLHTVLVEFRKKYPRINGVDTLLADLEKYEPIDADVDARQWVAARRRVAETEFATPLFRDQVRQLTQRELPSTDVVRRYYQADDDWRNGDTAQALAALEILSKERWGDVAERRLARYRKVLAEYERLQQARGQQDYEPQLLAFFRMLDPVRDGWFADALAEEFRVHSDTALAQAERDFAAAQSAWKRYQEQGGIGPVQRLEGDVSASYRRLAALLSDAYRNSAQGLSIVELLGAGDNAERNALHTRIQTEVRLQRQSLGELAMVLEPSLKQAKLDLLPVIKTDGP